MASLVFLSLMLIFHIKLLLFRLLFMKFVDKWGCITFKICFVQEVDLKKDWAQDCPPMALPEKRRVLTYVIFYLDMI